jgi:hypothetical protein
MAFDLLEAHLKDHGDVDCENMILFITDGKEGDDNLRCSPGWDYGCSSF